MSKFVKQMKATDIKNFSNKQLKQLKGTKWLASIKRDGRYIQIHWDKDSCSMQLFTSGEKEFYLPKLAKDFMLYNIPTGIYEAELIYKEGKLGGCQDTGITSTWIADFKKGIESTLPVDYSFMLFNIINLKTYKDNVIQLAKIGATVFTFPVTVVYLDYEDLNKFKQNRLDEGWEGIMAVQPDTVYQEGKRIKTAIKMKAKKEGVYTCIDTEPGTGKYTGMIGSLVLLNREGEDFTVGSGLTDELRSKPDTYFIGKEIEIEYHRLNKGTPVQPVFKRRKGDD